MKRYDIVVYEDEEGFVDYWLDESVDGEVVKADIAEEMYDTLNVIRQSVPLTEYTQSKIDKILQKVRGEGE